MFEEGGLDFLYYMIMFVFNLIGVYEIFYLYFKVEYIVYVLKRGVFMFIVIIIKLYYGYVLNIILKNLIKISIVFILIGFLVLFLIL